MGRIIIGSAVSAIAMFILGFIFFATPLYRVAVGTLDDQQAATVQQALAANVPGTGTYHVPLPSNAQQTIMYGQGPIATVHYNEAGFAVADSATLISGLLLGYFVALLMGTALVGIDRRVPDFPSRAKLIVLFVTAFSAFVHLGQPVMFHHGWGYFIYLFITDALTLSVGGLIIARWFLAKPNQAPANAPSDV